MTRAEVESFVLGAALISPKAAELIVFELSSDDFVEPSHQLIFEAITDLAAFGYPIDSITVGDKAGRNLQPVINTAAATVPSHHDAERYIGMLLSWEEACD